MKPANHSVGSFICASSDGVGNCEMWKVDDFGSALPASEAEVYIFAEHEEFRVEKSDGFEQFSTG